MAVHIEKLGKCHETTSQQTVKTAPSNIFIEYNTFQGMSQIHVAHHQRNLPKNKRNNQQMIHSTLDSALWS